MDANHIHAFIILLKLLITQEESDFIKMLIINIDL